MKNKSNLIIISSLITIIIILVIVVIILITPYHFNNKFEIIQDNQEEIIQDNNQHNSNNNNNSLSRQKVLDIVLNNMQITQNDIYDLDIELDYKYGKTVYQVEFKYQLYEYEYYINAENGDIIKAYRKID